MDAQACAGSGRRAGICLSYQWKSLFLPHGTVLRTVFKGKSHHCRVDVDQILYQGEARSPSGFVNAVGGIRRNAWKSVWLLFPDSKHWQLADTLRARKHPAAARRASPAARPLKAPAAAVQPLAGRVAPSLPAPKHCGRRNHGRGWGREPCCTAFLWWSDTAGRRGPPAPERTGKKDPSKG
ncbi:hypothetical protein LP419_09840 [Massilia sp. H-1]|nr:hypothetical protein LP419_09840 [Massilia sp. H-1]